MVRYVDLCAGQIRVALEDDGTVTWDGGNAKIDEVVHYLEQRSEHLKTQTQTVRRCLMRLWSEQVKGA